MHEILNILGLNGSNSTWYLLWSGFGSDLPIVAAIFVFYKHHKCENCFRLARHTDGGGYPVCRKHRTT